MTKPKNGAQKWATLQEWVENYLHQFKLYIQAAIFPKAVSYKLYRTVSQTFRGGFLSRAFLYLTQYYIVCM